MEPGSDDDGYGERGSHIPQEGEPDFIETNCHWVDCKREFDTQDELVKVRYSSFIGGGAYFGLKWVRLAPNG